MPQDPLLEPLTPPGTLDVPMPGDSPTSFAAMSAAPSGPSTPDGTAAPAPHEQARPRARRLTGPRRQLMITFGITASLVISALAIGVLYSKWSKAPVYETTIVAWGEKGWEGAKVTVTSPELPGGSLSDTFDEALVIRFHVPQGDYRIRVVKDGRTLAERGARLYHEPDKLAIWWPFRRYSATTQARPE
jgi:hypothetical protein